MTIFAFSIENYHRPSHEVAHLMNLFNEKLMELDKDDNFLAQHQVRVKFCGDLSMCDPQLT